MTCMVVECVDRRELKQLAHLITLVINQLMGRVPCFFFPIRKWFHPFLAARGERSLFRDSSTVVHDTKKALMRSIVSACGPIPLFTLTGHAKPGSFFFKRSYSICSLVLLTYSIRMNGFHRCRRLQTGKLK